jgi:hypothetical protein
LAISNTPHRLWFGVLDGFVRRRLRAVLRKQEKRPGIGDDAKPTINAGPMSSSRLTGYSPFARPMRKRDTPDEETNDWRAVCGRTARTVVCPVKAGMFSRKQTCRGKSQSLVVWIAEEMETEPSKPIDKTSPGEVTSHRAVTTVNALWPRK